VKIRQDFLNMDIGIRSRCNSPTGASLTVYYFNLFGRFFLGQTIWKP
jgi:hypothetical protein